MVALFGIKVLYKIVKIFWVIIGGIWTSIEILKTVFPNNQFIYNCSTNIWVMLIPATSISIIYGIFIVYITFFPTYKFDDKKIYIRVGNILNKKNGNIVVGINEQLENSRKMIGQHSIHMQLLNENSDNELQMKRAFKAYSLNAGEKKGFFGADINNKKYIFMIMSTIVNPQAISTSQKRIYEGLTTMLNNQEYLSIDNNTIYIPLLGTGEAGVAQSKDEMILLLASAFVQHCINKEREYTDKIKKFNIVVYYKDAMEIDWIELDKKIRILISSCRCCTYLEKQIKV